jgi:hypothetical protein
MSADITFSRESLDKYLNEFAKEFRKRNGKLHVELILVGGAAVIINYGFRDMTTDIDAISSASYSMKESILAVADKYGLPNGWLNSDFTKTASYSKKLVQYSKPYKTFAHVVEVRTITSEHLIAMKLVSGRRYKVDLSDIIGIVNEEKKSGHTITFDEVNQAIKDIYGGWDKVNDYSKEVLNEALAAKDLDRYFTNVRNKELETREAIITARQASDGRLSKEDVNDIIDLLDKKIYADTNTK